ncbi:transcriptional regulator LysR [Acetobacter aceti NRIC 0242]|uniref:Transcriptional regulator n=1 Tax=Acetobacter aceti NBRC 14818 TaxID=887700 RepID=A0AB33IFZ5_ACEAC|nr:LysR family transcriptional regulator [Acetobacter aceti]TCS30759.1 molybdate transport repressor ModE-like protein [Acetobacter aceti NBRC 14818]BCK75923.1 transcriptional regulator [Acetobacter aceti NBRC 14818]GAN58524.1 transcriptional regulator LysR [Acetobacter aceti NBRC 14818]GBO81734.1 transcriptional regulator LysR [Acetobacter aceti NRIC 0242]
MHGRRGLDWRDLQYFLAVSRGGALSVAARELGVEHTTVARRIQSLEQTMDATLFERHPRGYRLTRQGEQLLAGVEAMEREAQEVAFGAGGGLSGTVRISALEGFGNFFLAPRIGALLEANPDLTVEMVTIQQIVSLSRRQADLAIGLTRPSGDRFHTEELTDYRLFIYASPDYLRRHGPVRSRGDLADHIFAGYVDELVFSPALDYLAEVGIDSRQVRIQNSSIQAQKAAVQAGLCLGVLPAFVAESTPGLVRVLPEEISLLRTYWLITRGDEAGSSRLGHLCRVLRNETRAAQALFLPPPNAAACGTGSN